VMDDKSMTTASGAFLKPPLKPKYVALARKQPQGEPLPAQLCEQDGMPNMMGDPELMEILYTPGRVMIMTEGNGRVLRRITMDGSPKPDDYYPQLAGYSVGHWAGDTLVIETTDLDPNIELGGVKHGPNLHIEERWRLLSPTTLHSITTTYDPEILSRPWVVERTYIAQPGARLYEYVCEQNNRETLDQAGVQHVNLTPPK